MIHVFKVICCLYSFFFLLSCNQSEIKPSSSGKPGELIIVIDSTLWKGEVGKVLRDSLTVAFPGLPQYEPSFTLINIHPSEFRNILQLHRNVLIVETGPLPDDKQYSLTFKQNIWSSPQTVLNLRAVDENQLLGAILALNASVVAKIETDERIRMTGQLLSQPSNNTVREVEKQLNVSVPFNVEYAVASTGENYVWVRKETVHSSIGFQLFRLPYTSDSLFSVQSIIAIRDSLSKKYVPGPTAGSYMTTEYNYPIDLIPVSIDSSYGIQVKGLWRTDGDFMGGPFICFLIHDKQREELVFIDAFVYAPKFNKREYMKQVEAMVYAAKIISHTDKIN